MDNPKVIIPTGLSLLIATLIAALWTEGIAFTVPIFLIMALALITGYAIGFTHNHHGDKR